MNKWTYPNVAIIIINWNGWQNTIDCLESLYQNNYPHYNVILVDNGSEDNSVEKIKEYCEGKIHPESKFFKYMRKNKPITVIEPSKEDIKRKVDIYDNNKKNQDINNTKYNFDNSYSNKKITIIKNQKNYGFVEGNNIGIKYVYSEMKPDYFLLLNNDTVVEKEFLRELIKVSESNQKIGFVGPKTYYYNYNGKYNIINFAGGTIDKWLGQFRHTGINEVDNGQYDKVKEVDYVEGSCFLVKTEVIDKIGLLDPAYFAYREESDWCMRGYSTGYKSFFAPKAKIWHKISASSTNSLKIYFLTRNKFWFMKKHANKLQFIVFILYFFLFRIWYLVIACFIYREEFKSFLNGIIDGLKAYH